MCVCVCVCVRARVCVCVAHLASRGARDVHARVHTRSERLDLTARYVGPRLSQHTELHVVLLPTVAVTEVVRVVGRRDRRHDRRYVALQRARVGCLRRRNSLWRHWHRACLLRRRRGQRRCTAHALIGNRWPLCRSSRYLPSGAKDTRRWRSRVCVKKNVVWSQHAVVAVRCRETARAEGCVALTDRVTVSIHDIPRAFTVKRRAAECAASDKLRYCGRVIHNGRRCRVR
jgi:hypothetical protein